MSLTDGSLATLEGIQLQLAANLVGPNVQISGIDTSSINNITLQVPLFSFFLLNVNSYARLKFNSFVYLTLNS